MILCIVLAQPSAAFLDELMDVVKEAANAAAEAVQEAVGAAPEALDRIKAAILPDAGDLDVEQFLHLAQQKKARAVAIVKSGDKMILAKRENGALDRAAISTIKYQHITIDVCQKIEKNLPAEDREFVNCLKDADTGSNFVKTTTSNTELWRQLIARLQLR